MPSSSKKDVRESRANEASSSSSVKTEKISGNPENKTNPDSSGAKFFSSLQDHPKEEEYLKFTKYIYNLSEHSGETYGVL